MINLRKSRNTYSDFQGKHIRCFYSDGENNLPEKEIDQLPFKNLKYISLDLHLENRGINTVKNNSTALSTLASVIKRFIKNGKDVTIIANTSFPDEFNEKDFCKYLKFDVNPKIEKKEKKDEISLLHTNSDNITNRAHKEILRNVVIREAIEIENLIYTKVQTNFESVISNLSHTSLNAIKKFNFSAKIELYNLAFNNISLHEELTQLRKWRNNFAHDSNSQQDLILLDFLKQAEDIKDKL